MVVIQWIFEPDISYLKKIRVGGRAAEISRAE